MGISDLGVGGSWGDAVRERKAIVVNDFADSVSLARFLTVPIIENDEVVAVIGVGDKKAPYTDDDAEQLGYLSDGFWQLHRRRLTEEVLDRLYQAVEHSPVSISITDPQGTIEYANPRFVRHTGYSLEEAVGSNPRILQSGQVPAEVFRDLWTTILSGREWQGELINRKKNGELLWEWASISPVRDPEGRITHFIAVKEDITERKATQELVARAQRMETIGTLSAGVAHDFNNLLTSVLAFNTMLLRKIEVGNPLRVYAEKI